MSVTLSQTMDAPPHQETKPLAGAPPRIEWLDSIRGIAAILVMIIHYFHIALLGLLPLLLHQPGYQYNPDEHETLRDTFNFLQSHHIDLSVYESLSNFILGYWDLGKIGVVLFFFVSGFVIPFSLFKKSDRPILNFALSRFFRLYPIYWFALTLMLILGHGGPYSLTAIAANYTMFQKFIGISDINGVAWTLQIELIFYFLCAACFHFNLLKNQYYNYVAIAGFWIVALVFAAVKMWIGIKAPIALPLGLSVMFMGYVWRKWLLKEEAVSLWSIGLLFLGYFMVIPLISLMGYAENAGTYISTYYIAAVLLLLFTTVCKIRQPILLFLGKISYSVYLLHALIGALTIPFVMERMGPSLLENPWLISIPMLFSAFCSFALSSATYYWIEEPAVKLGRAVAKQLPKHQKLEAQA